MTAFKPGASPPPVQMAMRWILFDKVAPKGKLKSRMLGESTILHPLGT